MRSEGAFPQPAFSTFQVAATYIGTVVGAGFASGQEVLRFFTLYGPAGTLGLGIATLLFAAFGIAVLQVGASVRARSHRDLLIAGGGRWLGSLADAVVTGFLFAGTGVMIAGSGAIAAEQYGLPELAGGLVMAVAAAAAVLFGLTGVVAVTSWIVPALVAAVVGLAAVTLLGDAPSPVPAAARLPEGAAPSWWLAGMLYASYNTVLSISVLAPLGPRAASAGTRVAGGALGAIALGGTALLIHLVLSAQLGRVAGFEVPMLELARARAPLFGSLYALVLWAEIYTTAVASLYGVAVRLTPAGSRSYRWLTVGLAAAAFAVSRFGFANLVGTLYPAVGYLGVAVLAAVAARLWRVPRVV